MADVVTVDIINVTETIDATRMRSKLTLVFVFDAFESTAIVSIVAFAIKATGSIDTRAIRITIVDLFGTFVYFRAISPVTSVSDIAKAIISSSMDYF